MLIMKSLIDDHLATDNTIILSIADLSVLLSLFFKRKIDKLESSILRSMINYPQIIMNKSNFL